MREIERVIHDGALLGGKHQDDDEERHPNLLPFRDVGDFSALEPEFMRASTHARKGKTNAVRSTLDRVEELFRGTEGAENWLPYRNGKLDLNDPQLVVIRTDHGKPALDVVVGELQRIETVNGWSGRSVRESGTRVVALRSERAPRIRGVARDPLDDGTGERRAPRPFRPL